MFKVNRFVAVLFLFAICLSSFAADPDSLDTRGSVVAQITALNKKARQLNRDATNQAIAYAYKAYLLAYEVPNWCVTGKHWSRQYPKLMRL